MIELRPATLADGKFLFQLRNDPATVANSRIQKPVDWDEHVAWLERQFTIPGRKLWIAEAGDGRIGQIGYEPFIPGVVEIGLTVAPFLRGHGYGNEMVIKAMHLTNNTILAQVREGNDVMSRIFIKNGFRYVNSHGGLLLYIKD